MRKNQLNIAVKLFAFLIILTVFSSCGRKGVGCPNNFKALPSISINLFK